MSCSVFGCTNKAIVKGLCDKHRKRLERHGHIEATRPNDWGKREEHPLYKSWCSLRRSKTPYCKEWMDFWKFVKDLKVRPSEKHKIARQDSTKPYSKENFYWKEPLIEMSKSTEELSQQAAWMRKYRQKHPERFQNSSLKKHYGITLEDYNALHDKQKGNCAICGNPEVRIIRDKVIKLAVDHCHQTGNIRGLLCSNCNTGIGALKHDIDRLKTAIEYLEKTELEPFKKGKVNEKN